MKKSLLFVLLFTIAGYSQDHFSGITTSKRVGVLNIGLNPSELESFLKEWTADNPYNM